MDGHIGEAMGGLTETEVEEEEEVEARVTEALGEVEAEAGVEAEGTEVGLKLRSVHK